MCISVEHSSVYQARDSKTDNGFTLESGPLVICETRNSSIVEGCLNNSCGLKVTGKVPDLLETSRKPSVNSSSLANRNMNTLCVDDGIMTKILRTDIDVVHKGRLEIEHLQVRSEEVTNDIIISPTISDRYCGKISIKVVEVPTSILAPVVEGFAAQAAEEAVIDCGAKESKMQVNMQLANDMELGNSSVRGLVGKFGCSLTGPCHQPGQEKITWLHDVSSMQEASRSDEQVSKGPKEFVTLVEERCSASDEISDQHAKVHKAAVSGSMQALTTFEQMVCNIAACIASNSEVPTKQIESKATQTGQEMETAVIGHEGMTLESTKEHAPRRLTETMLDSVIEIKQQDFNVLSAPVQIVSGSNTRSSSGPELSEFFSNAKVIEHEVEIEEQDPYVTIRLKSPPKRKALMESPRSLRMLLVSDETALSTNKDEKHKRGGQGIECYNKVVPASQGNGNEVHNKDINFPKWHENADNAEASSTFSGPLAFSGALTYQGTVFYTGQVAYSGSISHRSDSSTSTRSFAFPILTSEWNTSPVRMGAPDPRFFKQQRKWQFCFCCRRPSTLFE